MRSASSFSPAAGFTLTEVLVAVVLLSLTFLGLAASAALAQRQFGADTRALAARAVIDRVAERAAALPCLANAGTDSSNAVVVAWRIAVTASGATGTATSRYPTRSGDRVESYDFAGGCR